MTKLYGQIPPCIVASGAAGLEAVMTHMLSHPAAGVVVVVEEGGDDVKVEDFEYRVEGIATAPFAVVRVGERGGLGLEGRVLDYAKKMGEGEGRGGREVRAEGEAGVVEQIMAFYEEEF